MQFVIQLFPSKRLSMDFSISVNVSNTIAASFVCVCVCADENDMHRLKSMAINTQISVQEMPFIRFDNRNAQN